MTFISLTEAFLNVGSWAFRHVVRQLLSFIWLVKSHSSGIAVHCRAGLGRTGTVACAYLIRECGMTAEEAIGFCRICRPGSVVGCQQHFLKVGGI